MSTKRSSRTRRWLKTQASTGANTKRYSDDLLKLQESDGVNVYRTPDSVMAAQLAAWDKVTARIAEDDPFFAKVMESQKAYAKNVMNYLNLNQPDYKLAYNHYFG